MCFNILFETANNFSKFVDVIFQMQVNKQFMQKVPVDFIQTGLTWEAYQDGNWKDTSVYLKDNQTLIFKRGDNDLVEVDAEKGIITILK